jgi:hypothetical protein
MDVEKIKLASVKLTNGGMKGLEIEYLLPSIKGNVQFFDTYKAKRKAPVHEELESTFSWLKSHLLDICGYTLEEIERDYLMGQCSVTGIKYGDKGIVVYGDLLVLGGTRVLKMETPLITDDVEYPEFSKLKAIAEGIYSETKEYLTGKKVMSDAQIVARFNAKNAEFDAESFTKMSKEEQRELATKILEDQGCMVFHNDEITADDAPTLIAPESPKPKKEKKATVQPAPVVYDGPKLEATNADEPPAVDAFAEEVAPEPAEDLSVQASRKLVAEPITLKHDDDDFELPIIKTAEKKSTAKKVKA